MAAQRHDIAVHPVSPVFLYARTDSALQELAPEFAPTLARLQQAFRKLIGLEPAESEILVLEVERRVPCTIG